MTTSMDNYRETLIMLKNQLIANRFLRWWLGELGSILPAWMRSSNLDASRFFAVALGQVDVQWTPPENAGRRELVLTLPRDRVLSKTVTLPLATEENLRQVLEFQMEQHTPFSPDQVYFGCAVVGRDFERGRLTVKLLVTPRDVVDAAIRVLEGQGVLVRAVFVEDMWEAGDLVNLLPVALGKAPPLLMQGVNPWLAAAVALLALSAMALPLIIKREAVVQMLPWVEKGKKAAEAVDAVRRELEGRVEQHNYLLEKRQATPTVIQTLEELTRILPDDTWVLTLDLKGKELVIQGETASSVRLVGLFEQSRIFKDASFRSPLTKGQASGTERFQLALQVRPGAQEPAASAAQSPASSPAPAASGPHVPSGAATSIISGSASATLPDSKKP